MRFDEETSYLIDNGERENAIEVMSDWLKHPKEHSPEICIKVLTKNIIEPLSRWLENELRQGFGYHYTHIAAGRAFLDTTYDMANHFKNNKPVTQAHINTLNEKWGEFLLQIGLGEVCAHFNIPLLQITTH